MLLQKPNNKQKLVPFDEHLYLLIKEYTKYCKFNDCFQKYLTAKQYEIGKNHTHTWTENAIRFGKKEITKL